MQQDASQSGGDAAPGLLPELLDDWLTIWHSELAALALDRELAELRFALLAPGSSSNSGSAPLPESGPPPGPLCRREGQHQRPWTAPA